MSADTGMSSRDYEREATASRNRLAGSLRELTDRLTPGQVMDEMLTYARGGGGTFLTALSSAARDNPVPSLLIGAGLLMFLSERTGLASAFAHKDRSRNAGRGPVGEYDEQRGNGNGAWSGDPYGGNAGGMTGNRRGPGLGSRVAGAVHATTSAGASLAQHAAQTGAGAAQGVASGAMSVAGTAAEGVRRGAQAAGQTVAGAADAARGAATRFGSTVADAGARVTDGLAGAGSAATDAAGRLIDQAQRFGANVGAGSAAMGEQFAAAAHEAPHRVAERLNQTRDRAMGMVGEQPLVAAAVGLAIGAIIAAALPKTRVEDAYLGEASDTLKRAVNDLAGEEMEMAKSVASNLVSEVVDVVQKQGVTPETAAAVVHAATDRFKEATGLNGGAPPQSDQPAEGS